MLSSPADLERCVLLASDASNPQVQQQANNELLHFMSNPNPGAMVDVLLSLLTTTKSEQVIFFVLTGFQSVETTVEQRQALRFQLIQGISSSHIIACWNPTYVRTKVGVMLSKIILKDFPDSWPTAFQELQDLAMIETSADMFLRVLRALMEDLDSRQDEKTTQIKDILRGLDRPSGSVRPQDTLSAKLLDTVIRLLGLSLQSPTTEKSQVIGLLCLNVIKGFNSWLDLTVLLQERLLSLVYRALAIGSTTDSPNDDFGIAALEALQGLFSRGMEDEKRMAMLAETQVLSKIRESVNLQQVDASPIDVVLAVATFVNRIGLEVFPLVMNSQDQKCIYLFTNILELLFCCYSFDDIDVSGAVVPLAGSLVQVGTNTDILKRLMLVTFQQMRYPDNFQFDFEDDMDSEEEMYRTELRKVNQKLVRAVPELSLSFAKEALGKLSLPLSSAPFPDIEVSIRLLYHYCEGIRPPPGLKVVMKNEAFVSLICDLHSSNIADHSHSHVLMIYYETAVRYYPVYKQRKDLLEKILAEITGQRGLQHPDALVRSRSSYLLLRLVKSLGGTNNPVLRPYVETAITGILGLLGNASIQLRTDDKLYLFETVGLLLGKTGLPAEQQKQYLTQVLSPHVSYVKGLLEQKQAITNDPETYVSIFSGSIAAIAFLTKGFKDPGELVQSVFLDTMELVHESLATMSFSAEVRNKTFIFLQRLIQVVGKRVLPIMHQFLHILVSSGTEEDTLDLAQLFNQLSVRFKEEAVPSIDNSLVPFMDKCLSITMKIQSETSLEAGHVRTEQLSHAKLTYSVMQHISANQATGVLLTPTNLPHLEKVLKNMLHGAVYVEEYVMKKTSIMFFRDLAVQWLGSTGEVPLEVSTGFLQFLCTMVVPGVLQSFLLEDFNGEDANQFRCIAEFASLLSNLAKVHPEAFQTPLLTGLIASNGSTPSTPGQKEIEVKLKEWIASQRIKPMP